MRNFFFCGIKTYERAQELYTSLHNFLVDDALKL